MSKVSVTKDKLDILANAIANKSGEPLTLTLDEMVSAVDGIDTSGITPTGNIDITQAGVTDVTNYATATVNEILPQYTNIGYSKYYTTQGGQRKWIVTPIFENSGNDGAIVPGYAMYQGESTTYNAIPTGTTITPTTSAQTIGGANYMMEGAVTVSAMPTGTAGTPTATKGTVSNNSVTVTPSVTNTTGYITGGTKNGTAVTVSASELVSGTKSITANGTGIDVTNYASVDVDVPSSSSNDFIVTLTQNQQGEWMPDCTYAELYSAYTAGKNIVATAGGSSAVSIFFENNYFYYSVHDTFDEYDSSGIYDWGVISGDYTFSSEGAELDEEARYYNLSLGNATPSDVTSGKRFYNSQGIQVGTNSGGGSPTLQNKTVSPTTSQQSVQADSGYDGLGTVTVEAMPSGTAGTPWATKGTVSNHSVSVTPSVTNTTGYVTGGTVNGTAVSVSASELVSGTLNVTSAGTKDVTNYASASIPSGTEGTPTATKGTVSNHSVSVTPSVTNTSGFISGGTKTGTAVSVSASELVSGTKTVTTTGTSDVTNYASVNVDISFSTIYSGTSDPSSSQGVNGDIYLKVVS